VVGAVVPRAGGRILAPDWLKEGMISGGSLRRLAMFAEDGDVDIFVLNVVFGSLYIGGDERRVELRVWGKCNTVSKGRA